MTQIYKKLRRNALKIVSYNIVMILDIKPNVYDTLYMRSDLRTKEFFPFKHSHVDIHEDRI